MNKKIKIYIRKLEYQTKRKSRGEQPYNKHNKKEFIPLSISDLLSISGQHRTK